MLSRRRERRALHGSAAIPSISALTTITHSFHVSVISDLLAHFAPMPPGCYSIALSGIEKLSSAVRDYSVRDADCLLGTSISARRVMHLPPVSAERVVHLVGVSHSVDGHRILDKKIAERSPEKVKKPLS